jgi:hypothetical protein
MVRFSDLLGRNNDGAEPRRDGDAAGRTEGEAQDDGTPNEPAPPPPTEPPPPPPPASSAPSGTDLLERLTDYATRAAAAAPTVEAPRIEPQPGAQGTDAPLGADAYGDHVEEVDDDLLPRRKRRKSR